MNIFNLMNDYFLGEKIEALVFILPIGLLSLVLGSWLFTEGGSFFRGVSLPFILMGIIMSIVGGVVGLRTPAQVAQLEQELKSNPQPTLENELARMKKVNDAWPKYLVIWTAFAVIGLGLRFLTKNDFAQGLGISLVFFSGVTLLVDGFAERRAVKYTQAISQPTAKYHD
ncbi:MAG: hypothetical protein RJB66_1894 [Pseudomonadota bacterium]|jgi:hypothetical protein